MSNCKINGNLSCVKYTGPSIPCANITTGEYYDEVVVNLAGLLCSLIDQNSIDIGCLYSDCSANVVSIPEGVQAIINFLCSFTTDNLKTSSSLSCITGNNPDLINSIKSANVDIKVNTTNQSNNFEFSYPTPENTVTLGTKTTIQPAVGSRIITASEAAVISLSPSAYPLTVSFEQTITTPQGPGMLGGSYLVTSGNKIAQVNLTPVGSNLTLTQTQFNELVDSELCNLRTLISTLEEFNIPDCEYIDYLDKTLNSILQVHSTTLKLVINRLENLGNELVSYRQCDSEDCSEEIITISLAQALNRMQKDINSNKIKIVSLETKYEDLKLKVESCCEGSNGGSTGGKPSGGSCPGGICF